MANAYTTRGGLILPEVGQNLNTWGDLLNNNNFPLVDKGLFGFESITVTGDFSLTRTNGDSTSTQINKGINLVGAPAADFTVTVLSYEHIIRWRNNSGRNATIKVSAGSGVTLANGQVADLGYNAALGDVTLVSPNRFPGNAVFAGTITMSGVLSGMSPGIAGTDGINKNQLDNAIALLTTVTSPGTFRITSTDTTAKFAYQAIVPTSTGGIATAVLNSGANETLDLLLAINAMTALTSPADGDFAPFYDLSGGTHGKMTFANMLVTGWPTITQAAAGDYFLTLQASSGLLKRVPQSGISDEGMNVLLAGVLGV